MGCEVCEFQIMKGDRYCSNCGAPNTRNIECAPSGPIKEGQTIQITLDQKVVFTGDAPQESTWRLNPLHHQSLER